MACPSAARVCRSGRQCRLHEATFHPPEPSTYQEHTRSMATGLIERGPAAAAIAREPTSVEQTGLDLSLIADLALKLIFYNNQITAQMISDELCLPFYNIIDKALIMLKKEELIEVAGSNGFGEL